MSDLKARVARLENLLRPAECRRKEVNVEFLYYELYTEHPRWLAEQPKRIKISFEHKLGHPRWF